jgi:hypothetical protein
MRVGSTVTLWGAVAALATACGGDSATEPGRDVDLRGGKPQTYQAELLPLPQGVTESSASGVNSKGQIVGSAGGRPVRWDPGAAPVYLEVLPGHEGSHAIGISDAGDIVGGSQPPQPEGPVPVRVVRWLAGGGIQDLGEMCCDAVGAAATNKRGDVAWVEADGRLHLLRHGALTTVDVPNQAFRTGLRVTMNDHDAVGVGAFVWSSHGGWTPRSSAYDEVGTVTVRGINNRNDVVAEDEVFLGSLEPRGTLYPGKGAPVAFGFNLVPQSINNFGVIAGWSGVVGWNGFGTAATSAKVRYADGTIVELPKPIGFTPGTEVFVSPAQINDAGVVVGYSRGTIAGVEVNRATMWRPTK